MRTTRLTDMLIEVDNDIRFTDHFLPPAQKGKRDRKEICTILAAVLGHGCNLGLGTMADLIQGISYKQLRRVSDWQMTQEAQRAALAAVVHAISRLDTTIYWGEGRTSASDGQRFEEHYTDTHGYTELNFAAFAMLGRRFCPRIKDVKQQHIYRIDATMDSGSLLTLRAGLTALSIHRRL